MDTVEMDVNPQNYFRLKEHSDLMLAHIVIMVIAWVFVLPIAVMLTVARSRFCLPAQLAFLVANSLGVILGIVFNHKSPNLYEKQKHGPIGLVSTWIAVAWVSGSLIRTYAGYKRDPMPSRLAGMSEMEPLEHFADNVSSLLLDQSRSSSSTSDDHLLHDEQEYHGIYDVKGFEKSSVLRSRYRCLCRFLSRTIGRFCSCKRTLRVVGATLIALDRTMLLFGYLCVATGVVVYGGIFHGRSIYNGLAHFIKGSIFFWYGLLTFGRWTGCFADCGWAWNAKPPKGIIGRWPAMVPSAEFVESAVICSYGASNVWLEHLSNPGGEWAAIDLEHVSITLLFFGGGLLGMLIESAAIRDLSMATIQLTRAERTKEALVERTKITFEEPEQWRFPMNPMPALVIYLLGSSMGAHHQSSKASTMLHAQWGNFFVGFALARIATYAILYLKPPTSYLPQRTMTEIIASFCLMSGGILLMASNRDTVKALEFNSLDAMFVFNATMGFTAFLMAWVAVCLAIKGWAQMSEAKRAAGSRM